MGLCVLFAPMKTRLEVDPTTFSPPIRSDLKPPGHCALLIGREELVAMDLAKTKPVFWGSSGIQSDPLELTPLDRGPIACFQTGTRI